MGLRTLISDLAKDAWDVAKKGANVVGDVTGVKQFASGAADAIVARQMGPEIQARNQRDIELNNQIMKQAAAARKKGDKKKARKLLSLATPNQIDIEKDVLGHSFDESIKNTKVGAAKLAATAASAGIDAVPVATSAVAKVAPKAAAIISKSPTARLAFASTIRGLENAATQYPIDAADVGFKEANKKIVENAAFGAGANVILSPRLLLKSGKEIKGAASQYEVGLSKAKPGEVQLNSGLPLEVRKKAPLAKPLEKATPQEILDEAERLAAIHTTSAKNLKKSVNAGGFPAPSIAIKKNPAEFEDFGQIQVAFGKDTIDPKLNPKNKVFADDIYSPRVPQATLDHKALMEKLLADPEASAIIKKYSVDTDTILRNSQSFGRIDDVRSQLVSDVPRFSDEADKLSNAIEKAGEQSMVVKVKDLSDTFFDLMRGNKQMQKYADNANDFDDFVMAATSDSDVYNFLEKKATNANYDDVYNYLEDLRPHFEKDLPLTADNYVKLLEQQMRGADVRVQEGGFSSGAPLTARLSKQFDSIEDIKAGANRLTGVDEEAKAKEALVDATSKLAEKLGFKAEGYTMPSERLNTFVDELQRNFGGRMEPEDIMANSALMRADKFDVPSMDETAAKELSDFLKDVQNGSKAYYFEAKPMRVVGMDEVKGVLVPDTQFEWLAENLAGTPLENKLIKYADGPTPEIRTANRAEAWKKLIQNDPNAFFGMAAGFEPEMDDQGNITGFKFNPEKAGAGFVIGSVANSKGGKEFLESLISKLAKKGTYNAGKEEALRLIASNADTAAAKTVAKEYGVTAAEVKALKKAAQKVASEVEDVAPVAGSEIEKVAANLRANNPGLSQIDSEAMAKDVIKGREFNTPPAQNIEEAGQQMASGQKLGFVETVEGAQKTPDALREALNKMDSSYSEITNKDTLEAAVQRVGQDYEGALARAKGPGQQTADSVAEGLLLMDDLVAKNRFDEAAEIAENMARKAKDYGQANQALAMYSRLTPAGALRWAERTAERANALIKNPKKQIQLTDEMRKTITDQAKKLQQMNAERNAVATAVDNLKASVDTLDEGAQNVLKEQVKKLDDLTREKQIESAKLVDQVARIIPPSLGNKFADFQTMAQLLNAKTAIRNVIGNLGFMGSENVSDVVAAGLDKLISVKTGLRTKVAPSLRVQATGAKQGWKLGLEDALRGVDTADYASQFDLPKTPSFRGKAGELFNKMLSVELKAPDRAFYTAAYTGSVENQLRASGNAELLQKWNTVLRESGFQQADKLVPDSIKEVAHFDGLYRTFQDQNALSTAFQNVKKTLNLGQDFGYGDIVLKYPKTPANIIMRGMAYTPAGMVNAIVTLARTAAEDPRIRQRKFVEQMARSLVGTGAIATGYVLAKNGIITGKGDSDKDIEAVKSGSGGGKYRVNFDALKRYVASGFDSEAAKAKQGDQIVSYDWFQPSAIQLSIGANMAETQKDGLAEAKGAATTFIDSAIAGADTIADQPLMRGVRSVFGGYSSPVEAMVAPLKDAPASFVPGALNQVRQYTDNTARSTYDPSFFGEATRKVLNRIPGASQTLEPQMTVWGDERELFQGGGNNLANVFLNPAFVSKMDMTPEAQMVLDLYDKTGETKQAPTVVKKKYKINGENKQLTPEEYASLQRYVGKKATAVFHSLATNPNFELLDDDAKIKMLSSYLTDIGSAGKIVILGNHPDKIEQGVLEILSLNDADPFGTAGQGDQATDLPEGMAKTSGGTYSPGRKGKKPKHVTLKVSSSKPSTTKLDLSSSSQSSGPVFRLTKKIL